MSTSETLFHVDVESDVETFIIATDYSLLRREFGPFSGKLPSGIYKFKFRRGTAIYEELSELAAGVEAVITPPPEKLELDSAAPLERTKHSDARQVAAARETSRKTHLWHGQGSSIYLFIRTAPGAPPRDVRMGITLHALDGTLIAGSAQFEAGQDCAAMNAEVEPGAYRLRMLAPDGSVEQIVIASAGWQTQVFLLHEPPSTVRSPLALATASILMCRGGFDPDNEMLRLAESVRIALSLQRGAMPRHVVSRLITEKFESPMLGIYGAHAIALRGGDDDLLEHVLEVLESLVPGHPDVAALRLGSAEDVVIDTPPMLRTSWNAIIAANADGRVSLAPGSLASRMPASLLGGTPWLIWEVEALLHPQAAERNMTADLSDLEALIEASLGAENDPASGTLSGAEEALYSYLRSRVTAARYRMQETIGLESMAAPRRGIDDRRLARAFGATMQQVQTTVSSLASKLKTLKE
jgi:hypothetical protein